MAEYVLGEPQILTEVRRSCVLPLGQAMLGLNILQRYSTLKGQQERLRLEYRAIVEALGGMGVNLGLIVAHQEVADVQLIAQCIAQDHVQVTRLPSHLPSFLTSYPREMHAVLKL